MIVWVRMGMLGSGSWDRMLEPARVVRSAPPLIRGVLVGNPCHAPLGGLRMLRWSCSSLDATLWSGHKTQPRLATNWPQTPVQ